MDALQLRNANCFRISWAGMWTASVVLCAVVSTSSPEAVASTYQTRNFSVSAATPEMAEQVGQAAEAYRHDLAVFWLGKPLPNWSKPCRIRVKEGSIGAGGQTTFQFSGGEVYNWNMYVQGTLERILDSVLPHEINHTIFACHFRRPLPRWADEGAATLFEDRSEQLKQLVILNEVIKDDQQRFSLRNLMSMKEYPKQHRPMLILYAQGYALVDFLIQQKGRQTYLRFLADGETIGWEEAIRKNFDHGGIESLERNWQSWVIAGMPFLVHPTKPAEESVAIRSQSPDKAAGGDQVRKELLSTSQGRVSRPDVNESVKTASLSVAEKASASKDSLELAKAASEQHSKMPRRASIQAPRPVVKVVTRETNNGLTISEFEETESANPDSQRDAEPEKAENASGGPSNENSSPFFEAAPVSSNTPSLEGARPSGKRLVESVTNDRPAILMLTSSEVTDAMASNEDVGESQLLFESVHLPRERNEVSGATPQWAGFPGQKQSF